MNRWKSDFSLTYMKSAPKQEDLIHFPSFAIRVNIMPLRERWMMVLWGVGEGSYFGSEDLNLEPSVNGEV